ncbi:MAG: hypothetical protein ABJP45_18400 [Cyclobacteriaceae bacterium]
MSEQHSDNVYAFNRSKKTVYVLDVPKGKNGYACCGCGREVIAIHRSKETWQPYFRHHVTDVKTAGKCSYRDETYRHKLAKEILQRIKQVRVPGVKKNPPMGMEGDPMIISKPRTIHGAKVLVERQFYEGEDNLVHYGANPKIKIREHLIKPDITFLDDQNKPILFIEVVATHAVNQTKYLKIKRLGIDTIQVRVPKDSPEEIEKSFFTVKHTKWIYNNELESTTYIPTSGSYSPGVSESDEFQGGVFDETLSCRRTQIGNLIRAIDRCFQSGHYSRAERSITRQLKDTKETTAGLKERYEKLREEAEQRAYKPFEQDIQRVESRRSDIQQEEASLEERYSRKRNEIEEEIAAAESKYQQRIETLGGTGKSFEERKVDIRREGDEYEKIIEGIRDDQRRERKLIESAPAQKRKDIRAMGGDYRKKIRRIDKEKDQSEKQEISASKRFHQLEDDLRSRIDKRGESFAQAVRERDATGDGSTYGKLRAILNKYGRYSNLQEIYVSIRRVKKAKEWFDTAPWTGWG